MSACTCKEDLEARLTERFAQNEPKGRDHKVTLKGYSLVLTDNTLKRVPSMPYEAYALMPLVKGGEKPKKSSGSMMFSFCPFCGVKLTEAGRT